MQSDVLDGLLSSYLEVPVKATWSGGPADLLKGCFDDARVELAGLATAWLPLQRVVLEAEQLRILPGLPARVEVDRPRVVMTVGQDAVDGWLQRFELPFRLELAEGGLVVHTALSGFPIAELETSLEVVRGWFVLRPRRAALFGVPGWVPSLLRSYLPVPPLSEGARLAGVDHEPGALRLTLAIEDLAEDVTPGLVGRLRRRLLPFQS